jgi:parvulin-like peptidyl-prolyl isomerase
VIRRLPLAIVGILAVCLLAGCGRYLTTAVAVVNGESIAREAFDRRVASLLQSPQLQGALTPDDAEQRLQVERQVILELIRDALIRQEARRLRIRVSEAEVQARLDQVRAQFPNAGDFAAALRQSGLTEASLRDQVRARLIAERLLARVAGPVEPTEEEIRTAYGNGERFEEIRVRHILFRVPQPGDETAARRRAEAALAQIRAGADFAAVARQQSEDEGTRAQGGDLGTITRDAPIDEHFKAAAFALRAGQVSDVVRTSFGFHIIRVDARTSKSFEEVRTQLADEIRQAKLQEGFQRWLADAARRARIAVNPRYGDFNPETLEIEPHRFFVPPSPAPETEPLPL